MKVAIEREGQCGKVSYRKQVDIKEEDEEVRCYVTVATRCF